MRICENRRRNITGISSLASLILTRERRQRDRWIRISFPRGQTGWKRNRRRRGGEFRNSLDARVFSAGAFAIKLQSGLFVLSTTGQSTESTYRRPSCPLTLAFVRDALPLSLQHRWAASVCICATRFRYCRRRRRRCRSHRRPRPRRRCCRWFSRQAVKFDRRLRRFRRQLHKWQMQKRRNVSRALCAHGHCEKTKVPSAYLFPSPSRWWSANTPVSHRITIPLHNAARPKTCLSYFVDCSSRAPNARLLRGISRPVVELVKYSFRRTSTWNCNFRALLPSSFSPFVHLQQRRLLDRFQTGSTWKVASVAGEKSILGEKQKTKNRFYIDETSVAFTRFTSFDVLVDLFFTRTREFVPSARRIRWLPGWLITRE